MNLFKNRFSVREAAKIKSEEKNTIHLALQTAEKEKGKNERFLNQLAPGLLETKDLNNSGLQFEDRKTAKGRLEKIAMLDKACQEPYFTHLVYDETDLKTGGIQRKSVYLTRNADAFKGSISLPDGSLHEVKQYSDAAVNFYYARRYEEICSGSPFEYRGKRILMETLRDFIVENGDIQNFTFVCEHGKLVVSPQEQDRYFEEALKKKKDEMELSDIVRTIRPEQNHVIQANPSESLLVQGCAGSGKTVVMLHRLEKMQTNHEMAGFDRIIIATPNQEFETFISPVIASLGLDLEKTEILTFEQFEWTLIREYFPFLKREENWYDRYFIRKDFQKSLLDESVLPLSLSSGIYSASFLRQIQNSVLLMAQELSAACPLFFNVFKIQPGHPEQISQARLKVSDLLKDDSWKKLIRLEKRIKSLEKRSEKRNEALLKKRKREQELIQRLEEKMAGFEEALRNTDIQQVFQLLSADFRRLEKRVQKLDGKMQDTYQKVQKILLENEWSEEAACNQWNALLQSFRTDHHPAMFDRLWTSEEMEIEKLVGEAFSGLDDSSILTDLAKQTFSLLSEQILLKQAADAVKYFAESGKTQSNEPLAAFHDQIQNQIVCLQNWKEDPFNAVLPEHLMAGASDFLEAYQAIRDLSAFSRKTEVDLQQLLLQREELAEEYETGCIEHFGVLCSALQLKTEADLADAFWQADRLFDYAVREQIPEPFRDQVSLSKIRYSFNLTLTLWFYRLLFGPLPEKRILLCVDEAQDRQMSEYQVLKNVCQENLVVNFYGDLHQNIELDRGIHDWRLLEELYRPNRADLNYNYRNPRELTAYCNEQLSLSVKPAGMPSQYQVIKETADLKSAFRIMENLLSANEKYRAACIVKNLKQKEVLLQQINATPALKDRLDEDLRILTIREAKGLEFQIAAVFYDGMSSAQKYVAFTRALKDLVICSEQLVAQEPASLPSFVWPANLHSKIIQERIAALQAQLENPASLPFSAAEKEMDEDLESSDNQHILDNADFADLAEDKTGEENEKEDEPLSGNDETLKELLNQSPLFAKAKSNQSNSNDSEETRENLFKVEPISPETMKSSFLPEENGLEKAGDLQGAFESVIRQCVQEEVNKQMEILRQENARMLAAMQEEIRKIFLDTFEQRRLSDEQICLTLQSRLSSLMNGLLNQSPIERILNAEEDSKTASDRSGPAEY